MKWIIVIILSIVALYWGIWTAIGVFILGSIIISIIKIMFKNPGNYFLSISFEWKDIFRILEVPESQQDDFEVSEKYEYQSPNANGTEGLGINSSSALFEYYIIPNSLRNRSYSYSSIYDQQLKRFFESPNINYGPVLKNSKKKDSSLICFFKKGMPNEKAAFAKAGFAICFSQDSKWKTIIFLFYEISYDGKGDNIVKKVSLDPKILWLNTSVQSQDDAQSGPFDGDLHKFFKK